MVFRWMLVVNSHSQLVKHQHFGCPGASNTEQAIGPKPRCDNTKQILYKDSRKLISFDLHVIHLKLTLRWWFKTLRRQFLSLFD